MSTGLTIQANTEILSNVIVEAPFRNYGGVYLNLTVEAFSYIVSLR